MHRDARLAGICAGIPALTKPRLQAPRPRAWGSLSSGHFSPPLGTDNDNNKSFESLPPRGEETAHRDARLAREIRRLTSMAWDA